MVGVVYCVCGGCCVGVCVDIGEWCGKCDGCVGVGDGFVVELF